MESLPRLAPPCVDVRRRAGPEYLPEAFLPACPGVGGELDPTVDLDFLESLRKELDQERARLLGARLGHAHGDAAKEWVAQRNAARSFSKKPSSAL